MYPIRNLENYLYSSYIYHFDVKIEDLDNAQFFLGIVLFTRARVVARLLLICFLPVIP